LSEQDYAYDEQQATTLSLPPHAALTIDFTTDDFDIEELAQTIAKITKWDSKFIDLSTVSRRQMITSVSGYVYANPISSSSAYNVVESNKAIIEAITGGAVTVQLISSDDYRDGAFIEAKFNTSDEEVLYFEYSVLEEGSIVCIIENGEGIIEDTHYVYIGIMSDDCSSNRFSYEVSAGESGEISWNFTELVCEGGTYSVNCIACNAYPGDPSCSDVNYTDYMYINTSDSDSGASTLIAALAAYLLI
jgi:hypothetical protein